MNDRLRVLVLGACNLNDTFYSLERSDDRWPRIRMVSRDFWHSNTPVVHSLQDTLQLVRLCSGELQMPSWVANYVYASQPLADLAVRGRKIYGADLVLFEYSTSVEIAFREFRLNRNEVHSRIGKPLIAAMPDLQGAYAEWFTEGLLKQNEEISQRGAARLLARIPENMPQAADWRAIISEARGLVLDERQIEEGVAALRARFDCPFGVVMPALRYTADGRGWCWPPAFAGQLEDVCVKLKLPMLDIGDVVRDHGVGTVLMEDLYHLRVDFSGLLDAALSFATKLADPATLASLRLNTDFRQWSAEAGEKARLGALAWMAADAKNHENAGAYYQTRFSCGQFFANYDVDLAFYCVEHFGADDFFVELGMGLGELSLLLALGGLNTLGIESDSTRYAGAVVALDALRCEECKLDNLELRKGLYPAAFEPDANRVIGRRVLVCSHVAGSYLVEKLDETVESFVHFDDLVIDVEVFGKRRNETEIDELIRKIEGVGFGIVAQVSPGVPAQFRHFRRVPARPLDAVRTSEPAAPRLFQRSVAVEPATR